jgi:NAD(P)H-nitrite reductase large subunit
MILLSIIIYYAVNKEIIFLYKNLRRIKRFKNSLGIPKFTRNVMDKNNLRNYRLISASTIQNLQQEDKRVNNNEQTRNIEMEIDENYFGNYCKKY